MSFLTGKVDPTYQKMDPEMRLSDPQCIGTHFERSNREFQVLVELPSSVKNYRHGARVPDNVPDVIGSDQVNLSCCAYGEDPPFIVTVSRDATVAQVKEAIWQKERYGARFKIDASELTLYLTLKDGQWLDSGTHWMGFLLGKTDTSYQKMDPEMRLSDPQCIGTHFERNNREFQVLVELPSRVRSYGPWTPEMLASVNYDAVRARHAKCVVRISCGASCVGTSLVLKRTAKQVFLFSNLRLWLDASVAKHLSAKFRVSIKRLPRVPTTIETLPAASLAETCEPPLVTIERRGDRDDGLVPVLSFALTPEVCYLSSAGSDFAVFRVHAPTTLELEAIRVVRNPMPPEHVLLCGFQGNAYVTTPAFFRSSVAHQRGYMSVSGDDLPATGFVCVGEGRPVGYLGGPLAGDPDYRRPGVSYAFDFVGFPVDRPSSWRPPTRDFLPRRRGPVYGGIKLH